MDFTLLELSFLLPLFALCAFILARNWTATALSIWSPMSLLALLFLYYTVLGPIYFVMNGDTDFLGVSFRPIFWKGWMASLISLIAVGAGYLSYQGSKVYIGPVCSDELLQKFALWLIGLTFLAMLYWTTFYRAASSMFNPFASDEVRGEMTQFTSNPFANYLVNFINLSIPAMVLSLLLWLQKRSTYALVSLLFVFVFGVSFFLSSGFRFRIVWMVIAMTAAFYLWRKRRPNPLVLGLGGFAMVAAMGLVGLTRNYWAGLSLEKAQGASVADMVDKGFEETGIFLSACSVVDAVPDKVDHTYWDPIWVTLTFPIPRSVWQGKPESQTLLAMAESFGSRDAYDAGQAMPFFAEWYVAFGWPGLITVSFLVGWGCKRLWVWFLQRRDDKLVILTYTVTLGFLYFFFSRGYTPIMTMNFIFGLLPFFLFYGWLRRKAYWRAFQNFTRAKESWERTERLKQAKTAKDQ